MMRRADVMLTQTPIVVAAPKARDAITRALRNGETQIDKTD
jgi:hypothetical protein